MKLKTKTGEEITFIEALKRFKKGVQDITPVQKLETETRGTLIQFIGFVFCFFAVIYMRETIGLMAYGLILVFLGSSITTGLKWLSLKQQLKFFKDTDKAALNLNDILSNLEQHLESPGEEVVIENKEVENELTKR